MANVTTEGTTQEMVTPDPDLPKSIAVSIVLSLVCAASLVLNTMMLVLWCRADRLRKPTNYFQITLTLVDLLAAVFWCILSITAAVGWQWTLGQEMCTVQGVISTWCFVMTTTLFSGTAFEKCLKLIFPSKHASAFQKNLVILLLGVIIIYSGVIALFPIMTWGDLRYITSEAQCHFLFEKSISHLGFMLVITYVFPLIFGLFCYGCGALKVWYVRRKQAADGKLILEEDKKAPRQTFGQLLRRLEAKYRNVGSRKIKPQLGQDIGWEDETGAQQGYDPNEDSASEISENEDENQVFRDYSEGRKIIQEREQRKKRIYHLRRRDIRLALVTFLIFIVYMVIWLPFWIVSYQWTFHEVSEGAHLTFTILSYFGLFSKPPMYLLHEPFRHEAKKYLVCPKKKIESAEDEKLMEEEDPNALQYTDADGF